MSVPEFEILLNVPSTDNSWKEWRKIVEEEGWKSDDHSVMELTPILSTTRSVVAKDLEGNFLSSVVWNEYDGIAFIGFYLTRSDLRGKGIGSVVWKKAMEVIPKNYTIGLRAVPSMLPKYQGNGLPVRGPTVSQAVIPWKKMMDLRLNYANSQVGVVRKIRDLCQEDFQRFIDFDRQVVRRDREDFLRRFYLDLSFTSGAVLINENHEIIASAGITPTSLKENHLFKLAPVYANSLEDFFTVIQPLVTFAAEEDPNANILFHILGDSRGEKEILPTLEKNNISTRVTGTSAFSREYINPLDTNLVYLPNNNSGHYDA